MALMVSSLYEALRSADVPEEKARRAAEDVANFDDRARGVEASLTRIEQKLEARFTLLQWMLGFNLALTAALIVNAFR